VSVRLNHKNINHPFGVRNMSFLSKVELKRQLQSLGIKVEGNYVRKKDIEKIMLAAFPETQADCFLEFFYRLEDEGFWYAINGYSSWKNIKDPRFHKLLDDAREACKALFAYAYPKAKESSQFQQIESEIRSYGKH